MPNIVEFQTPQRDIPQPTDLAANTAREVGAQQNRFAREAGEAIGGAVAKVGGQIGQDYDNHVAGQMIGHGSAVQAQLTANLTGQIADTMSKADPNDVSVGQGQRENVEKSVQAFQDQFSDAPEKVQNWALQTADRMRDHFNNSITAYEMDRAGAAAMQNMRDTVRANANTVALDPASLGNTIDLQKQNFDAYLSTHTLPVGTADKLREHLDASNTALATAAVQSMAQKNPAGAKEALATGDYDKWLDPKEKLQLSNYADVVQRNQEHDAKQAKQSAKEEAQETSQNKTNEYMQGMYDPTNGRMLRPSPATNMKIMNDPNILPKDKTFAIRWNETQYTAQVREDKALSEGNAAHDDAATVLAMKARIGNVDNPLTRQEVMDGLGAEKMTRKTAADMAWRIGQSDAGWNAVQRQFAPQFNILKEAKFHDPQSIIDPVGTAQKLNDAEHDAQITLRKAYAAHEPIAPLLDPKSPTYVLGGAARSTLGSTKQAVAGQANDIRNGRTSGGEIGVPSFASKEEAEKAGIQPGTRVKINGVAGTLQ